MFMKLCIIFNESENEYPQLLRANFVHPCGRSIKACFLMFLPESKTVEVLEVRLSRAISNYTYMILNVRLRSLYITNTYGWILYTDHSISPRSKHLSVSMHDPWNPKSWVDTIHIPGSVPSNSRETGRLRDFL